MQATNTPTEQVDVWIVFEDQEFFKPKSNPLVSKILRQMGIGLLNKQFCFQSLQNLRSFQERLLQVTQLLQSQLDSHPNTEKSVSNKTYFFGKCIQKISDELIDRIDYSSTLEPTVRVISLTQFYKERFEGGRTENRTYVAWVLDTDGLDLVDDSRAFPMDNCRTSLLNRSNSISTLSLRPFFNIRSNNSPVLSRTESYLFHPQNNSTIASTTHGSGGFFTTNSYLLNPISTDGNHLPSITDVGCDHVVLFYNPNLESLIYSKCEYAKAELIEALELVEVEGPDGKFYSGEMDKIMEFVTPSVMTTEFAKKSRTRNDLENFYPAPKQLPYIGFKSGVQRILLCHIVKDSEIRFHASLSLDQSKQLFSSKNSFLQSMTTSALYLAKGKKPKKFPVRKKTCESFGQDDFERDVSLFKYSIRFESAQCMDAELVHNPNGIVKLSRQIVWSPHNRCNGRTNIHFDQLSKDKQQRFLRLFGYGYAGFKPCERFVKGQLRCRDHQP